MLEREILQKVYKKNADFVIPQNPKYGSVGGKVLFCHLVALWFSINPKSIVRIYDNHFESEENKNEDDLYKFIFNAEISTLTALVFGTTTKVKGYTNKERDYTNKVKELLENRLQVDFRLLDDYYLNKPLLKEYYQIHPDFYGNDFLASNKALYSGYNPVRLRNEYDINSLFKKLFERAVELEERFASDLINRLQTIFYELFHNACDWGRFNWMSNSEEILDNSIRAFSISTKLLSKSAISKRIDNSEMDIQLRNFFEQNLIGTEWGAELKLLELSFFDNGLGIVQTFSKKKLESFTIEQEYDILMKAFMFGKTSDTSILGRNRGLGLYKVAKACQDVFITLRTGRLHLYRNFSTHPFSESESFFMFDVSDSKQLLIDVNSRVFNHRKISGTSFAIFIPLSKNITIDSTSE